MHLLSSAGFFSKLFFKTKFLSGTPSEFQTVWDSDQDRRFVGPDLYSICLQISHLSTDEESCR